MMFAILAALVSAVAAVTASSSGTRSTEVRDVLDVKVYPARAGGVVAKRGYVETNGERLRRGAHPARPRNLYRKAGIAARVANPPAFVQPGPQPSSEFTTGTTYGLYGCFANFVAQPPFTQSYTLDYTSDSDLANQCAFLMDAAVDRGAPDSAFSINTDTTRSVFNCVVVVNSQGTSETCSPPGATGPGSEFDFAIYGTD